MTDAISIPDAVAALPGPWQPTTSSASTTQSCESRGSRVSSRGTSTTRTNCSLCWDGAFVIELEGAEGVEMKAGDVFVVPKGVRHRPVAERTAHAILLERPETEQYGNR